MANEIIPFADVQKMAQAIAHSNFFGVKTPEQAIALMLVAQAEGRHPASIAMDYHIIQNRPALKADAMLSRYQAAGGKIAWHCMTDEKVSATFTHPASGDVEITWDMKRAEAAELLSKNGGMFKKYPRQMLRARVISEGVRASFPGVLGGFYAPEEVELFDNKPIDAKIITHKAEQKEEVVKPEPSKREVINARVKKARMALGWDVEMLNKFAHGADANAAGWAEISDELAEKLVTELEAEAMVVEEGLEGMK